MIERPPRRPGPIEDRLAGFLFRLVGPRLAAESLVDPPPELQPFEERRIPRLRGNGAVAALFLPADGWIRGGVLFLHPWLPWGRTYFWRRGRLEAARAAGYASLVVDLPGFGASSPPRGLYDLEVLAALEALRSEVGDKPLHVWGVSSGGYWAHPVISGAASRALDRSAPTVAGAMFEDVSPHLIDWSRRVAPWGRPFYRTFQAVVPRAYRYLAIADHAAARGARAVSYVSGGLDRGVVPEDTRRLAEAAGGEALIVPEAQHLGAIKVANLQVIELALRTFAAATI
jgi:pimeloyl-ACP methyl ester carboxylesterase